MKDTAMMKGRTAEHCGRREVMDHCGRRVGAGRQYCLHRRILVCLFTLLLVTGFSMLFFSLKIRAQNRDEDASRKCYRSIMVEYGDTLWDYADRYGDEYYKSHEDYIEEVLNINSLATDEITSGQYLIVPYYIP